MSTVLAAEGNLTDGPACRVFCPRLAEQVAREVFLRGHIRRVAPDQPGQLERVEMHRFYPQPAGEASLPGPRD